jgi:hypothetical protein
MKYIIEIAKEYEKYFKGILICGIADGKFAVDVIAREDLEELTSDYINEHFGELQDEAYKRGFEDGKWESEDGCTGCQYEGKVVTGPPCITCCNSYRNQWTAKKQDDEIKAGDEVIDKDGDKTIVTHIHGELFDGLCHDGSTMSDLFLEDVDRTGRHFDIDKLLEEMTE